MKVIISRQLSLLSETLLLYSTYENSELATIMTMIPVWAKLVFPHNWKALCKTLPRGCAASNSFSCALLTSSQNRWESSTVPITRGVIGESLTLALILTLNLAKTPFVFWIFEFCQRFWKGVNRAQKRAADTQDEFRRQTTANCIFSIFRSFEPSE